ncbi:DUF4926 domain-containing protein [uncultured Psychrobacter sp.]|uniref:DUF4926 domain-containing protein n=1 Tax=uncultured Psychrobacter sp. TaxID=259303 RepID=UPI003459CF92
MFEINDVVKVLKDLEDHIQAGDSGTVVDIFDTNPPTYMIEFIDDKGRTLAAPILQEKEITLYWSAKTKTFSNN